MARKRDEEVSPDRTVPVVFEMVEPIPGFHQRGACATDGISETDTVRGAAIVDLLLLVGCSEAVAVNGKNFDCFGNVLEVLSAEISITKCEFLLHLVVGLTRNADAAMFCDA